MDSSRPQFSNFPLTKQQVRSLLQQQKQVEKELYENRSEMQKISRKNMQQVGVYFQRLRMRHEILNNKLNQISEILQTNDHLSLKKQIETRNSVQLKNQSVQLMNDYKTVIEEKKNIKSFNKKKEQETQLEHVAFNNYLMEKQRREKQNQVIKKKNILKQGLQNDKRRLAEQQMAKKQAKRYSQTMADGGIRSHFDQMDDKKGMKTQNLGFNVYSNSMSLKPPYSLHNDIPQPKGNTNKFAKIGKNSIYQN